MMILVNDLAKIHSHVIIDHGHTWIGILSCLTSDEGATYLDAPDFKTFDDLITSTTTPRPNDSTLNSDYIDVPELMSLVD